MSRARAGIVALLLSLSIVRGHAQSAADLAAIKSQIDKLLANQQAMERELQQIRALLEAQGPASAKAPAAAPAEVSLDGASKGNAAARVTLVEFSDYECPYCTRYTKETLPLLDADYIKTGKVRYVFRNFPLESLHPLALRAHQAAGCAGENGKYWEMHDVLFANSPAIGPTALVDYAKRIGLDQTAFLSCVNSGRQLTRIRQDIAEGRQAGATGTPTFYVGFTPAAGKKMPVITMLSGAQPYSAFKQVIEAALLGKAVGGR